METVRVAFGQPRAGCVDVRELPLGLALAIDAELPLHRRGLAAVCRRHGGHREAAISLCDL